MSYYFNKMITGRIESCLQIHIDSDENTIFSVFLYSILSYKVFPHIFYFFSIETIGRDSIIIPIIWVRTPKSREKDYMIHLKLHGVGQNSDPDSSLLFCSHYKCFPILVNIRMIQRFLLSWSGIRPRSLYFCNKPRYLCSQDWTVTPWLFCLSMISTLAWA